MIIYTVKNDSGFHGGVCEAFQQAKAADGKTQVNLIAMSYGRPKPVSETTGVWSFYVGDRHLVSVDLDELNAGK